MSLHHGFDSAHPVPATRRNLEKAMTKTPQKPRLSRSASSRVTKTEAQPMPQPPAAPDDRSAPALLRHWHDVSNWLEKEVHTDVHGEGAIDAGAAVLNRAFSEVEHAPCDTPEAALAKLRLLQADDGAPGPRSDKVKRPIINQVAEFLARLQPPSSPLGAQASAWEEAVQTYEAADRAVLHATVICDDKYEEVQAAVPVPSELDQGEQGILAGSEINAMKALPKAVAARLRQVLHEYNRARDEAEARLGYDAACAASEAADEAWTVARDRLLMTTPPDHTALLQKLRILWSAEDLSDPDKFGEILTLRKDWDQVRRAIIFRDVARLAGITLPIDATGPWDVAAFGTEFIANHRGTWDSNGNPSFEEDDQGDFSRSYYMLVGTTKWHRQALHRWLRDQPNPRDAEALETKVRAEFRDYASPTEDAVRIGKDRWYSDATVTLVVDHRIDDLISIHRAHMDLVTGWIGKFLDAGGNFVLDPGPVRYPGPGPVLYGYAPENDAAQAVAREIDDHIKASVSHWVHDRMKGLGLTFMNADTVGRP